MNQRKLFIISGVIGAVGLVIILISLMIVQFNLEELSLESKYIEKIYTANASEISEVNAYTHNMKVSVRYRKDDSNEIKIIYYENDKNKPTIENKNGIITLQDQRNISRSLFGLDGVFYGIKRSRLETVIELPKDCKNLNILVDTNNGEINANDMFANNIELITSNAKIFVSGEINDSVLCKTSNASIDVDRLIGDKITLKTSNGKCNIEDIKCNNLEVTTSNATIDCKNAISSFINLKTSNGRIETGNIVARNSFYADTSNAQINVKSVDSDKIELYSSNGGIDARVIGNDKDYAIESGTSNGNNNTYGRGNNSADKSIKVYTSNANINVDFSE